MSPGSPARSAGRAIREIPRTSIQYRENHAARPGRSRGDGHIIFLELLRAKEKFDPTRGTFKTWLLQYVYTRTITRKLSLTAHHFYDAVSIDLFVADLARIPDNLLREPTQDIEYLVDQALLLLEPRQRTVIELTYFEGRTAAEAAVRTGRTTAAIRKGSLSRTRQAARGPARETCARHASLEATYSGNHLTLSI